MAKVKFTGVKHTNATTQVIMLNPNDIVVNEALRARHFPPTVEAVRALAVSMLDGGQLEPICVRQDANGKPIAVFGVTRVLAGQAIRAGFLDANNIERQDETFTLRAEVAELDEAAAFIAAIRENADRNEVSPVDKAFNHERLRTDYGMTDADISRVLGVDKSEVSRLKKLLKLDESTLHDVHRGELAYYSAIELVKLPESKRAEALASTGGNLTALRELNRADVEAPQDAPPAPQDDDTPERKKTATQQRTAKQIITMMLRYVGEDTHPAIATVAAAFIAYAKGEPGYDEKAVAKIVNDIDPQEKEPGAGLKPIPR